MMKLPKDTLTEEEIQSGLTNVLKDGVATQAMVTLTGGVFLVSFALKMGPLFIHWNENGGTPRISPGSVCGSQQP